MLLRDLYALVPSPGFALIFLNRPAPGRIGEEGSSKGKLVFILLEAGATWSTTRIGGSRRIGSVTPGPSVVSGISSGSFSVSHLTGGVCRVEPEYWAR